MRSKPVFWTGFLLNMVEATAVWPQGVLDAYFAMIPKVDGDSTPSGQRPLRVLPVVCRLWASHRLTHSKEWADGWVPQSAFCHGEWWFVVEAWFSAALDVEEVLSGACNDQLHVMVADVI